MQFAQDNYLMSDAVCSEKNGRAAGRVLLLEELSCLFWYICTLDNFLLVFSQCLENKKETKIRKYLKYLLIVERLTESC